MLKSMSYDVTFPVTGRRFNNTIAFDTGLTAVTGRNEAGKSLVLEFVCYSLFGSVALRGAASDYKSLSVTLDFEVKGVPYRVFRKGSKAELFEREEQIASGTKPVNAAVQRILGYDWQVFQMGNLCAQGKIEALGDMKPAERKKAVDQTIGLSVLDDLSAWCHEQMQGKLKQADTIESLIGEEPEAPARPDGYAPVDELQAEVDRLRAAERRRTEIEATLRTRPGIGPKPVPPCPEDAGALQINQDERTRIGAEIAAVRGQLDGVTMVENATEVLAAWDLYHKVEAKRRALAGLVDPGVTMAAVEELEARHELYAKVKLRQKLLAQGHHECPACHHQWPVADGIPDVPDQMDAPPPLGDLRRRVEAWEASAALRAQYADVPDDAPRPAVSEAEARRADPARYAQLKAELDRLAVLLASIPNRHDDLERRRRYETLLASWEQQAKVVADWDAQAARLKIELETLPGGLREAEWRLEQARRYETLLGVYADALARWNQRHGEMQAARVEAEQWKAAKASVAGLRQRVKQYLLPSLNGVASALISQMTGGARQQILVDDDFEVLVDGQALNTLSGSGKAVANLSLRIALGLVLTNRVFSVFMGDELDAAMDADRAGFTAEALSRLTDNVAQVLLVSHKEFDADNTIQLQ